MGETLSNQIGQMLTDPVPWLWHTGDGHGDSHLPLRGQKGPSGALALGRTRGGEGLGVHCGHLPQEGLLLLGHPGPEMSVFHHPHHCAAQSVPPSPSQTPLPNTGPIPKVGKCLTQTNSLSLQHGPGTGSIISPSWSGNTRAIVGLLLMG